VEIIKTDDGKVEVRIDGYNGDVKRIFSIRVDNEEVLAFEISTGIEIVGRHDYEDGHEAPSLKITKI